MLPTEGNLHTLIPNRMRGEGRIEPLEAAEGNERYCIWDRFKKHGSAARIISTDRDTLAECHGFAEAALVCSNLPSGASLVTVMDQLHGVVKSQEGGHGDVYGFGKDCEDHRCCCFFFGTRTDLFYEDPIPLKELGDVLVALGATDVRLVVPKSHSESGLTWVEDWVFDVVKPHELHRSARYVSVNGVPSVQVGDDAQTVFDWFVQRWRHGTC